MSDPIISLRGVGKAFGSGESAVTALEGVDLDIRRGEIFAVIGPSGAGKSTLLRLVNGLERATSGSVVVDGVDVTSLRGKGIREVRSRIGMVFQQFNLFTSRTVVGNVTYPLELAGWSGEDQRARAAELLHFVGLLDKAWAYPAELSGGQKQRIGIARALAGHPTVLLADESTSALDPETTRDVLALLRRVNEELGLTIVVITHEMEVVRAIADRVAVLDRGRVVETGAVADVLSDPRSQITRRLVAQALPERSAGESVPAGRRVTVTSRDEGEGGAGAVLAHALRSCAVDVTLVGGGITHLKHESLGSFTLALRGPDDAIEALLAELATQARVEEAA